MESIWKRIDLEQSSVIVVVAFDLSMRQCPVLMGSSSCSIATGVSVAVATTQDWLESAANGSLDLQDFRRNLSKSH